MIFDLSQIPFSCCGSYMAVSELPENWQGYGISHGVYLKTVSGSANSPIVAKIVFPDGDISAAFYLS